MADQLRVIYVPGVGDSDPTFQRNAVNIWKLWGVEAELLQMNWASQESWPTKLSRILRRIDELDALGHKVALVGASAGGAAVISAFAARSQKIAGVVCICGKLKNPNDIGRAYRSANPSLVNAVAASDKALGSLDKAQRQRILCRYALFDGRVTTRSDSKIEGARNSLSPSIGHAFTIGLQLVFGAPSFLRFLKKQF